MMETTDTGRAQKQAIGARRGSEQGDEIFLAA